MAPRGDALMYAQRYGRTGRGDGTLGYDDTMTALQTPSGAGAHAALRGPSGRLRAEIDQRVNASVSLVHFISSTTASICVTITRLRPVPAT